MDTGGLGLLQLLLQAGISPQALMAMLSHQQTPGQPEQASAPPAPAPPELGATSDAPGLSFSDGTPGTFGAGGQTIGQIGSNAFSGARNGGLLGQVAKSMDLPLPNVVGSLAAKALSAAVPGLPLGLVNILLGAAKRVADVTLKNNNMKVGPIRFGAPPVVPDIHFDATGLPTNPDNTEPDVPEGQVTVGPIADISYVDTPTGQVAVGPDGTVSDGPTGPGPSDGGTGNDG